MEAFLLCYMDRIYDFSDMRLKKSTKEMKIWILSFKGVLHPWALYLKTLCIFSKNKAILDKVSYGSGQKCSKVGPTQISQFTSAETNVVKLG